MFVKPLIVVILMYSLFPILEVLNADELTIARVRHEAPLGWNAIAHFYEKNEFSYRDVDNSALSDAMFFTGTVKLRNNGGLVFYRSFEKKLGDESFFGESRMADGIDKGARFFNKDYKAAISLDGDNIWRLIEYEPRTSKIKLSEGSLVPPTLAIGGDKLTELLIDLDLSSNEYDTGYFIKDAWPIKHPNNEEIVRISLLPYRLDDSKNWVLIEDFAREGLVLQLDLAPQRNWCVAGYEFNMPHIGESWLMEVEFKTAGFHPYETRMTKKYLRSGRERISRRIFSDPKPHSLRSRELQLSYYGLPEPDHLVKQSIFSSLTMWLLSIFVILFVLFMGRVYFKRR